jgi:hypothetical protein
MVLDRGLRNPFPKLSVMVVEFEVSITQKRVFPSGIYPGTE